MSSDQREHLRLELAIQVDDPYSDAIDTDLLEQVAYQVLAGEDLTGAVEVGVRITSDAVLHELNREFRGVDAPTDVLSFGEEEGDENAPPFILPPEDEDEETARYLGDLAISYDRVVSQAAEYGHSRRRELAYLLAHGLLHLLGYDHEQPVDAAVMREREERYLGQLGLSRENEPPEADGR